MEIKKMAILSAKKDTARINVTYRTNIPRWMTHERTLEVFLEDGQVKETYWDDSGVATYIDNTYLKQQAQITLDQWKQLSS